MRHRIFAVVAGAVLLAALSAQQAPPGAPPPPAGQPAPTATAAQPAPPAATVTPAASGKFFLNLQNSSLKEVIDILARNLKINYILDPRVGAGAVSLNTYGRTAGIGYPPAAGHHPAGQRRGHGPGG